MLDGLRQEMDTLLGNLRRADSRGATVKIQEGKLLFDRDPSEKVPRSVVVAGEEISARLPNIELTDLLVEVDGWTRFSSSYQRWCTSGRTRRS